MGNHRTIAIFGSEVELCVLSLESEINQAFVYSTSLVLAMCVK